MIEECNFKSKIQHHESSGCDLTPKDIVCPGEKIVFFIRSIITRRRISE